MAYATLHRSSAPTGGDQTDKADPTGSERQTLRLRQIGGPIELLVRFWPQQPAEPGAFEVRDDLELTEREVPSVASVITFSGPISAAVEQAAQRAQRERIRPGMAGHPGAVRLLTLWQPELRRQITITLATSLESLENGSRRIATMPLLPGEDVALLPGPDHVEMFRVG